MRQLKISKQITNRESQSLDKYLQEIGKVDLLTPDEEVILAQKIRDGDQLSLERLTKANLRFVVSVAKQYQHQGLSLSDLINEGNLGLIKAAQRFDARVQWCAAFTVIGGDDAIAGPLLFQRAPVQLAPNEPQSHRVRMVLAEKASECDVINVVPGRYPEDLLDLNPYRSLPTLVDRDLVLLAFVRRATRDFVKGHVPSDTALMASTALFVVVSILCAWLCARFAPGRAARRARRRAATTRGPCSPRP